MPATRRTLLPCLPLLLAACGDPGQRWLVRATLADGQVLMGLVDTPTMLLEGGLGTLAIPWDDVGEVLPVEGDELAGSGGFVDVWLRDGSELTGRWADPKLAMVLEVGGHEVAVDVPVADLLRLQTQGGEAWPSGVVYRAHTAHGDDFLVDPATTRVVLENGMGRFEPFLDECLSVSPVDEPTGPWRVELLTGTVLVGPLVGGTLDLHPPLGPASAVVPLEALVSLTREDWSAQVVATQAGLLDNLLPARGAAPPAAVPRPAEPLQALGYLETPAPEAVAPANDEVGDSAGRAEVPPSPPGWFDNSRLRYAKEQQQQLSVH
jgi:hypothetical protein